MCHAYVVWETQEKGAAAREPLRFIPQFRWGHDFDHAAPVTAKPRRRRPLLQVSPGWLRPALAGSVLLVLVLPFLG